MRLYNAIYCCNSDNHFIAAHLRSIDALALPTIAHCLYYGSNGKPPCKYRRMSKILPLAETRDNMGLKTYGLIKHALTIPGWTHLFKTDVNVRITAVSRRKIARADYAGCVVEIDSDGPEIRQYKNDQREPLLREPWMGTMPWRFCSGSAYITSRRLAEAVMERGAWYARGHYAEDVMVGGIAADHGFEPVPAVAFSDADGTRKMRFN